MKKKILTVLLAVFFTLTIIFAHWSTNLYLDISHSQGCNVLVETKEWRSYGIGSGVIIDSNGTIITAKHCVEGVDKLRVTLPDGTAYDVNDVNNVYLDENSDIAIIKLGISTPEFVQLGDPNNLGYGTIIYGIGNAKGIWDNEFFIGYIYKNPFRRMFLGDNDYIFTKMKVYPGCSGGGLYYYGKLVGIITNGGDITFAISVNEVKEFLRELED